VLDGSEVTALLEGRELPPLAIPEPPTDSKGGPTQPEPQAAESGTAALPGLDEGQASPA